MIQAWIGGWVRDHGPKNKTCPSCAHSEESVVGKAVQTFIKDCPKFSLTPCGHTSGTGPAESVWGWSVNSGPQS